MTDERSTKAGSAERAHHAGDDEPAAPRQRLVTRRQRSLTQSPGTVVCGGKPG